MRIWQLRTGRYANEGLMNVKLDSTRREDEGIRTNIETSEMGLDPSPGQDGAHEHQIEKQRDREKRKN